MPASVQKTHPGTRPGTGRQSSGPASGTGLGQTGGLSALLSRKRLKQRFFRKRAEDSLPLKLTHERIYIVPTSRGWVFVLSLLIMLIASINYSLSLGYALCFLLTGLFASTLLATYRNFAGISIDSSTGEQGISGQSVDFVLGIENGRTNHCEELQLVTTTASYPAVDIGANTTRHIRVVCNAPKRGWQQLGRLTLRSTYPLGLWVTWGYIHIPEKSIVWPAPEIDAPAPMHSSPTADNTSEPVDLAPKASKRENNSGEFAGIRPYREGDSPNRIAWKAASRGMGLQTRIFDEEDQGADITLDWKSTQAAGDTEARLSRLAAWCRQCEHQGTEYSLALPSSQISRNIGKAHLQECMKILALHGLAES